MKKLSLLLGIENKIAALFITILLSGIFSLCITILFVALAHPENITIAGS